MNIYLIRAEIEEHPYMNDHKTYEDLRIVMAYNEAEAIEKYQTFWENKNEDYSVSYYAYVRRCDEAIR